MWDRLKSIQNFTGQRKIWNPSSKKAMTLLHSTSSLKDHHEKEEKRWTERKKKLMLNGLVLYTINCEVYLPNTIEPGPNPGRMCKSISR